MKKRLRGWQYCVLFVPLLAGALGAERDVPGTPAEREAELRRIVEDFLDVLRTRDESKVGEAMAALFPSRDEMLAVFPKHGDAAWNGCRDVYAFSGKQHVKLTRRFAITGVPGVHEVVDIRSDSANNWTHKGIASAIPVEFPAYMVRLTSTGRGFRASFSTFVFVRGRWRWFFGVEKPVLEAIRASSSSGSPAPGGATSEDSVSPELATHIAMLKDADVRKRIGAARALGGLYARGAPAVPALVEAYKDEDHAVRQAVQAAFGDIGQAAVPRLLPLLAGKDPTTRERAAGALDVVSAKGEGVADALLDLLDDQDRSVRSAAMKALRHSIGPEQAGAVPVLVRALQEGPFSVTCRDAVFAALGRIGPTARDALPAVEAGLRDENADVRYRAASALGRIGAGSADIVPLLVGLFGDGDKYVRRAAVDAVGAVGANGAGAVSRLVALLLDENEEDMVRRSAIKALGSIGPAASDAMPQLEKLSQVSDRSLSISAKTALRKIQRGRRSQPVRDTGAPVSKRPVAVAQVRKKASPPRTVTEAPVAERPQPLPEKSVKVEDRAPAAVRLAPRTASTMASSGRLIVAVAIPFTVSSGHRDDSALGQAVSEMLVSSLSGVEGVTFVDRADLVRVLGEQRISLSDLAGRGSQVRVGHILGASHILTGAVSVLQETVVLNAHLIEVSTTRIAWSARAEGTLRDLPRALDRLLDEFMRSVRGNENGGAQGRVDAHPEANLHFMRGLGYHYAGMRPKAIAEFLSCLALKPDHASARYWAGMCYMDDGDREHAAIEFRRFVAESPDHWLAESAGDALRKCSGNVAE